MKSVTRPSSQFSGYLLVLTSATLFGSYGAWSREMGDAFEPFGQAWVRCLVATIVLVPIVLLRKAFVPVLRKDLGWMACYLGVQIICLAPLYYAFLHVDIGVAILIFYAGYVVASYLVGGLILREHIGWSKWVALVLAVGGLFLIFGFPSGRFSVLGGLLAVVNGIGSGVEISISKKLSHRYSALQLTAMGWSSMLVPQLLISLALGEHQVAFAFDHTWFAMFGLCAAGILAFATAIRGFRHVDATIGSIVGLFEIVVGVALGIALYGESLSLSIATGMILIMIAGLLPGVVERRGALREAMDHAG